tara:strand:+ start:13969 stop:17295 length:3327 start_codon:yes stop_codon:yes gene_type:complete
MNKKNFIIYILLVILIYFILYIIYNNFKKENFICINPKKINNNGFCKGLYPIRFMGSNPSKEELEKKCNDNKYCKGYIIVEYIYGGRTNYFALKCQDNWDGEIQYDDSFKDKIKEFLVEYYDYSSVEHLESEVNIINFENYKCNTVCPKGKGINSNNICINCPDNQYNAGDNYTCSPINYFDGFKFNTYDTNTGITNNTICPEGTYAIKGSKECTTCPDGEYQDQKGKTQCIKYRSSCPSGQFLKENNGNKTTDKTCEDCPTGHYSSDGITCTQVDAGYIKKTDGSGQEKCPAGTFSEGGSESCTTCPDNTYQDESGQDNCKPHKTSTSCPPGHYITGGSTTEDKICNQVRIGHKLNDNKTGEIQCPDGTYQDQPGQENCIDMKTIDDCESGHIISAGHSGRDNRCKPISIGYQLHPNNHGQIPCPAGTYQDQEGQDKCKDMKTSCPSGYYITGGSTTEDRKCIKVSKGYELNANKTDQIRCPAGTFSEGGSQSCTTCPASTYQDKAGQDKCKSHKTECPTGQYLINNGTKITDNTCKTFKNKESCNSGQILKGGTATSDKYCEDCPAGHYSENKEKCTQVEAGYKLNSTNTGQDACPAGKYSSAGSTSCSNCPAGTYSWTSGTSSCIKCSPGGYAPNAGSRYCIDCPWGTYQDEEGQSSCKQPDTGYVPNYYQTGQRTCPVGTHISNGGCRYCSNGKYQDKEGQYECKPHRTKCQTGYYVLSGTGTSTSDHKCKIVDRAYELHPNNHGQIPCPAGTYQDEEGQDKCKLADKGYYVDLTGQTTQKPCPAGTHSSSRGSASCSNCPVGKYQEQEGQENCKNMKSGSDCPAGTYLYGGTGTGNTSDKGCKLADRGYKPNSNKTGQEKCDKPGEYQDEEGQENCKNVGPGYEKVDHLSRRACPVGTYNDGTLVSCKRSDYGHVPNDKQTAQVKCPPGTIQNKLGQENCEPCTDYPAYADPNNRYQPNSGYTHCYLNRSDGYEVNSDHSDIIECSDGEYSNSSSGYICTKKITTCPPGYKFIFRDGGTHNNNECLKCNKGYYKEGTNNVPNCHACPQGQYQDEEGQDKCKTLIKKEECDATDKDFVPGNSTTASYCRVKPCTYPRGPRGSCH